MTRKLLLAALAFASVVPTGQAHFLWLLVGRDGKTDLVFEHSPRIGDGHYLDPVVKRGKTWIRTPDHPKPTPLKMVEKIVDKKGKKKKRWLTSPRPVPSPSSIDSYVKWGVYKYPKNTFVLLHYYARHIEADSETDLQKLARADQLQLDIIPTLTNKELKIEVVYDAKHPPGQRVFVRGPVNATLKTDDKGIIRVPATEPGLYTIRTGVLLEKSGQYQGKDYSKIHHQCTLTIRLPLPQP